MLVFNENLKKIIFYLWQLSMVGLGSGLIFLIGFLCQFLITSIFSDCCAFENILWRNAHKPFYFLEIFFSFLSGALASGFIFAFFIGFHKNKYWWLGAIYGILSLSIYDIGLELIHEETNLILSLFLNALGGPIAGIFSAYWARIIFQNNNFNLTNFLNITFNLGVFFTFLICLFIIIFFIFLYPAPQSIRLNFDASQNLSIAIKDPESSDQILFKKDSKLEKYSKNFPFLKSHDIKVELNTLRVQNIGGDIGVPSLKIISDKEIELIAIGVRGCESIEDAIKLIDREKDVITSNSNQITFSGLNVNLNFFQKENSDATIYLPYEKPIARLIDGEKLRFFSWWPVSTHISLDHETYIYFLGIPNFIQHLDDKMIFPEEPDDYKNISMEFGEEIYTLPVLAQTDSKNCKTVPWNIKNEIKKDVETVKTSFDSGFLVKISNESAQENKSLKLNIPNASWIDIDENTDRFFESDDEELTVVSFESDSITGELRIGERETKISNERLQVKGNYMTVKKDDDKGLLRGRAKIILANERLLTKSIFSLLETSFQILFLTSLFGFLTFLTAKFRLQVFFFLNQVKDGNKLPIKVF